MTDPQLTILGVYRPEIDKEVWQEQLAVTGDEEYTPQHFNKLVLIEAVVEGLEESFDMGEFGQIVTLAPYPEHMQVGYDEGLLSADGETLIQRRMDCVQGTGALRFAVYLHEYDPNRPLKWQHGEVTAPPIQDIPARLLMLMPYNACS